MATISRPQSPKPPASNRDPDNRIGFPSTQGSFTRDRFDSVIREENHGILTGRTQAPTSRKRVADDQTYDEQERRKRAQTGRDVQEASERSPTSVDKTPSLTGESSVGPPIINPPNPRHHVYAVTIVWAEDFGDGRIPPVVIDKLRLQMKA